MSSKRKTKSKTQSKSSSEMPRKNFLNMTRSRLWLFFGMLVLILLAGVFYLQRGLSNPSRLPAEITAQKAYEMFQNGAFVLDVRTPEEWNEYHVEGTTLIPLDQLAQRVSEIPADKPVVVVCRSGNRSQQGRDILRNAGITDVTSMAGGLKAWSAAGYPTVTGP
jgi:rhodanese-related sulfurtransferase